MCQPDLISVTLQRKDTQPPLSFPQLSRHTWNHPAVPQRAWCPEVWRKPGAESQRGPGLCLQGAWVRILRNCILTQTRSATTIPEVLTKHPEGRETAEILRGLTGGRREARSSQLSSLPTFLLLLASAVFGLDHDFREMTECNHPVWCDLFCQWTDHPFGGNTARNSTFPLK